MFFVAGATGFIGTHLIRSLAAARLAARCLVRNPRKIPRCTDAGMEVSLGDITDRESLRGKLDGCTVAVHLVGIIEEQGEMTFEKVHVRGTENLVEEAKRSGVRHFFYQSALGASPGAKARYAKTKAEAEEIVRASGIPFTIFRPSLVVGEGDGFTGRLKELIALGPFVPVPGSGEARLQPIYVGDWVKCFLSLFPDPSRSADAPSRLFELGGPEHLTYNEIVNQLMEAMGVNKPVIHLPLGAVKISLPFARITRTLGEVFGKKIPPVTREQLELLQTDNICARDSVERNFGFTPLTYREALPLFIQRTGKGRGSPKSGH
ncbi:MAG: complex I NDUFA9 subunit family protein [Alphaproteobacteria bacterium]|uniref:Complex I NDUFA9 subunit family protein n=1 Tax=Candidatus Nitrobium versatile TaxID=2884831 RepID=A0A953J5D4_9BACT|nr:complex I NDUFA9 subunit family protein [Candidatus Nitrobium versatile]